MWRPFPSGSSSCKALTKIWNWFGWRVLKSRQENVTNNEWSQLGGKSMTEVEASLECYLAALHSSWKRAVFWPVWSKGKLDRFNEGGYDQTDKWNTDTEAKIVWLFHWLKFIFNLLLTFYVRASCVSGGCNAEWQRLPLLAGQELSPCKAFMCYNVYISLECLQYNLTFWRYVTALAHESHQPGVNRWEKCLRFTGVMFFLLYRLWSLEGEREKMNWQSVFQVDKVMKIPPTLLGLQL